MKQQWTLYLMSKGQLEEEFISGRNGLLRRLYESGQVNNLKTEPARQSNLNSGARGLPENSLVWSSLG